MIIYKATNTINGKVYVGYTTKTLPERIKSHLYKANCASQVPYNQAFKLALRKYGVENFEWEELETCSTKEEACEIEKKYIQKFNSITPYGYNMTLGGEGGIPNDDVKKKISESVKRFHEKNPGYTFAFYLKKCTPEQRRENARKAYQTKIKNGFVHPTGFTQSDESKQKMSVTKGVLRSCVWYNVHTGEILIASTKRISQILNESIGTLSHVKHGRQPVTKNGWKFMIEVRDYTEEF